MPRTTLSLSKETLAELTSDEMSAVVGAGGSESCSCTIGNVCIGQFAAIDYRLTIVVNVGC